MIFLVFGSLLLVAPCESVLRGDNFIGGESSSSRFTMETNQKNDNMVIIQSAVPSADPSAAPSAAPSIFPTKAPKHNMDNNNNNNNNNIDADVQNEPEPIFLPTPHNNVAELEPVWIGGPFCTQAKNSQNKDLERCKQKTDTWNDIISSGEDITFHRRHLTGECGPNCRPSCVTLMLDLDKLDYREDLTCEADNLCLCEFEKCSKCTDEDQSHPKCHLEHADCLGATVYDDTVSYTEYLLSVQPEISLPKQDKCTSIPDDDLYCRFQDWKIVKPIEDFNNCKDEWCVESPRKIYWEYCNIVEEDPNCDQKDINNDCKDKKCGKACEKITEPFPPGWTTFVVSASFPYETVLNEKCDKHLEYEDITNSACFLQRVEIYYPEENEDCSLGCPHCHECPLLNLGDKFGSLEVVGFGHCLDDDNTNKEEHVCAACDRQDRKKCQEGCELDCDDLFSCHESIDCYSGNELGFPFFPDQCTFCNSVQSASISKASAPIEPSESKTYSGTTIALVAGIVLVVSASLFLLRRKCQTKGAKSPVVATQVHVESKKKVPDILEKDGGEVETVY